MLLTEETNTASVLLFLKWQHKYLCVIKVLSVATAANSQDFCAWTRGSSLAALLCWDLTAHTFSVGWLYSNARLVNLITARCKYTIWKTVVRFCWPRRFRRCLRPVLSCDAYVQWNEHTAGAVARSFDPQLNGSVIRGGGWGVMSQQMSWLPRA